jgi:hypothetical protein
MGELRKHRNNGKRSSVHIFCTDENGDGEKGESVQNVYLFNPSPSEYNFAKVKDDAIAFISILYYLVRGCVLCKVLLRTKCLFSRKGQHANVFLGLKRTMLFIKTMCTQYTAPYFTLQIRRIGQMFVL